MQLKLIRKLPIYDSKGNMTFIEGDITLADLSLRDYVSYKFRYLGKSVWTFRSDLLNAINEYNYHNYDIDSSVGFPGFSIYLFDKQVVAKVLRASEVDLTLDDGSIIPIDSLSYGVIREKTIEVPIDKQMILRNGIHSFHKARIVTTRELPNLMKHLDKFDELAFDSETIGLLQEIYKLDDREDFLVSISVSTDANSGYYIRATKTKEFRDFLKFLCTKHLIIHNAHFDVGMLKAVYGLVPKSFDDTLIMAKLMNENLLSYKLKDLATQVLGRGKQLKLNEFDYLTYLHTGNFDQIEYILAYYAAADTANTYGLYSYTIPKLKAQSELYKYYTDIEIKSIVPVSIAILENGLKVDKESLQNLSEQSETKLSELLSQMETIAQPYIDNINNEYLKEQEQARLDYWQEVFNDFVSRGIFSTQLEVNITKEMILNTNANNLPPFGSIKKLATYHNRLSAKPQGVNQYSLDLSNKKFMELLVYSSPHGFRLPLQTSKAGNASLNKASISELEKYLHTQVTTGNVELIQVQEFFNAFKEYTRIRKLLDAFITPTLESINTYKDGKLHANYNLLGTVSSRASCNNPNFQQLSNHKDLDVRRCFVVDDSSYSFLQFDYEAQELRVMAALSQDPLLIELIKNNRDLHSETVRRVWPELASCTDEEIKTIHKDKRNIAKTILFSLAYGAGPKKIAFTIQRPVAEAEAILVAFKEQAYPVLTKWLEDAYNQIEMDAGAEIIGGYRRHYKPTGNKFTDFGALRSINNSRIQGASAYITKVSTLNVLSELDKSGIEYKLVILIHDSITIQVKDKDVPKAWKIVEDAMFFDLLGIPVVAVGAVNKDMSKVTEQDLDSFMHLDEGLED